MISAHAQYIIGAQNTIAKINNRCGNLKSETQTESMFEGSATKPRDVVSAMQEIRESKARSKLSSELCTYSIVQALWFRACTQKES